MRPDGNHASTEEFIHIVCIEMRAEIICQVSGRMGSNRQELPLLSRITAIIDSESQ